jgi:hypothetical protein
MRTCIQYPQIHFGSNFGLYLAWQNSRLIFGVSRYFSEVLTLLEKESSLVPFLEALACEPADSRVDLDRWEPQIECPEIVKCLYESILKDSLDPFFSLLQNHPEKQRTLKLDCEASEKIRRLYLNYFGGGGDFAERTDLDWHVNLLSRGASLSMLREVRKVEKVSSRLKLL